MPCPLHGALDCNQANLHLATGEPLTGVATGSTWVGVGCSPGAICHMGLLDRIGIGTARTPAASAPGVQQHAGSSGAAPRGSTSRSVGSSISTTTTGGRKRGKRGGSPSARERVASAAAPLHERRRRLVAARESTLRDLGGLMLEMYKRNRFREELLLDKCEEVLAIEVEVAHVDQRLFQLAPPNAAGMRPIGRCECGAPIHPGQNFCGVCGRSFTTLTQARACTRCGAGLRAGDQFCGTCGHEAPDMLQAIEAPGPGAPNAVDASAMAASAVAQTVIIDAPPLDEPRPTVDAPPVADSTTDAAATASTSAINLEPPAVSVATSASQPPATGNGFDWSAPPAIADIAIGAALDAVPPPGESAPFSGFPLSATLPPPPDIGDTPSPASPQQASTPSEGEPPTAAPTAPPQDKRAAKAAEKLEAARKRARIKDAKARAKEARAQRKRGDTS